MQHRASPNKNKASETEAAGANILGINPASAGLVSKFGKLGNFTGLSEQLLKDIPHSTPLQTISEEPTK